MVNVKLSNVIKTKIVHVVKLTIVVLVVQMDINQKIVNVNPYVTKSVLPVTDQVNVRSVMPVLNHLTVFALLVQMLTVLNVITLINV